MPSNSRVTQVFHKPGFKQMIDKLVDAITHLTDPSRVLFLGRDEETTVWDAAIAELIDLESGQVIGLRPRETANGSIPRTLSSEADCHHATECVRNAVKGFKSIDSDEIPAGMPLNHVVIHEGDDKFLDQFLKACPKVHVWEVMCHYPDDKPGLRPRPSALELEGYDLTPRNENEYGVPRIPPEAMYGRAATLAKSIQTPLGYAYPAILACIAGCGVTPSHSIRSNLYVANLGPVHSGKSVTSKRAPKLFDMAPRIIDKNLSSDRGLLAAFPLSEEILPYLLNQDEFRSLLLKGQILNSTLFSVLCTLFDHDYAGTADKAGTSECYVTLSILGNLAIKKPAEFSSLFSFETAGGLYDRFIFGVPDPEPYEYTDLLMEQEDFNPTMPKVPGTVFEKVNAWGRGNDGRGRLKEIALRVAYLTAAANRDESISDECLNAAIKFMEWQEKIREGYQPAKGSTDSENCIATILDAFEKEPKRVWKWRDLCRKENLNRRFPRCLHSVKTLLTKGDDAEIGYDPETKTYYLKQQENQNVDSE